MVGLCMFNKVTMNYHWMTLTFIYCHYNNNLCTFIYIVLYQIYMKNVGSDSDGMKDVWRKYMEKLLNVENDWDVGVMGQCCLISEAAIKDKKM